MSHRGREMLVMGALLVLGAVVFVTGISWGLPSRAVDPFLFGDEPVWSGEKIAQLAGDRAGAAIGADVDVNPLLVRDRPVVVNETDAQRAEIIRRYRLFSAQPDEMITLMSLAEIREHRGDPRLYQYGGLWIYPVGVLLKLASLMQLIELRADQGYYLDHPEAFGRFYVVMRAYTAAWGLVGVWAVYWLTRRFSGSTLAAAGAAVLYICMPVVVNMAHEAKPHLPGAVIMLLAVMAACRYVETGSRRWWVLSGVACGAAFAMVISSLLIFTIIPVMVLMRPMGWGQRLAVVVGAGAVGAGVYMLSNPFVPINLLFNRQIIESNLGNSTAMYEIGRFGEGLVNAAILIIYGVTLPLAIVGVACCIVLLTAMRHCDGEVCEGRSDVGWLLAAPSLVIILQFMALAAGKPAEYARFALFPDIALAITSAAGIARVLRTPGARAVALGALGAMVAVGGISYLIAFVRDATHPTTRLVAAQRLEAMKHSGYQTMLLSAEPAPYSLPAVDLFHWQLVLVPPGINRPPRETELAIWAVDDVPHFVPDEQVLTRPRLLGAPISWASKPYVIRVK